MLQDKQLQTYYESCFATFGTDGWKEIVQDYHRQIEVSENIGNIKNEQELYFHKGRLDVLHHIVGLKDLMEYAHARLLEVQDQEEQNFGETDA